MATLEAMLKANGSLEQLYFQVDEKHWGWDMRTPGAALEKHNGEDINHSQHAKQKLAFLSVAKHLRGDAQQQCHSLDSTSLARTFDFLTPVVRRLVYLPPVDDISN